LAPNPQGDAFPLTRHSVVAAAQGRDPEERVCAMDAITSSYWRPVYKYVRLRIAFMQHGYYFQIMLPGAMVGLIVGYATQKYGAASQEQRAGA